jgi:hypothetical protein
MDWIKRNLYFLIGALVALALMGMAGWYLYSKWQLNNEVLAALQSDFEQLSNLNNQKPHPGSGKVNNIEIARDQQKQIAAAIEKARTQFQRIPPIPEMEKVTDADFSRALSQTIYQLQREATNAGVTLPPSYFFSFTAQRSKLSFAANSATPLSRQLGEIKAIADILVEAGVNSIDGIRREKVSADDQTSGTQSDYVDQKSATNQLAVLTPYEVTFRCFSPELAAALAGFASSPHGFIVKAMNVERAPATAQEFTAPPTVTTTIINPVAPTTGDTAAQSEAAGRAAMMRRYGIGPGGRGRYSGAPQPDSDAQQPVQPQIFQSTTTPTKPGPALDEKQLRVTLALTLVKLAPPKTQS